MVLGSPISLYYISLCGNEGYITQYSIWPSVSGELEVLNILNHRIRDTLQFTNNNIYIDGMQTQQDNVNLRSINLNWVHVKIATYCTYCRICDTPISGWVCRNHRF